MSTRTALAVMVIVPASVAQPCEMPLFDIHGQFLDGLYVLTPDLNGDGRGDLILHREGLGWFAGFGSRDGFAISAVPIYAGTFTHVATADLNGDGHPDVLGRSNDGFVVLEGAGDGSFSTAITTAVDIPVHDIAEIQPLDLDGDGNAEVVLIVAPHGVPAISMEVWRRSGATTFAHDPNLSMTLPFDADADLVAARLVAHEEPYLLVRGFNQTYLYLPLGGGKFGSPINFTSDVLPPDFAVTRISSDADDDLVVGIPGGFKALFFIPPASFQQGTVNLGLAGRPRVFTGHDFDADGRADIALVENGNVTVVFDDTGFVDPVTTDIGLSDAYFSDYDGDGLTDIAVRRRAGPALSLAVAPGTFEPRPSLATLSIGVIAMATADLDLDGDQDLITLHDVDDAAESGQVHVSMNDGGHFGPPALYTAGTNPRVLRVADVTGDTIPDVITAGEQLHVIPGIGAGLLGAAEPQSLAPPPPFLPVGRITDLAIGDLTGDGMPDLAFVSDGVQVGTPWFLMINGGNGDFTVSAGHSTGGLLLAQRVSVADLNSDAAPDVVTLSDRQLRVFLNPGDGEFAAPAQTIDTTAIAPSLIWNDLEFGDFDGDGRPDAIAANGTNSTALILFRNMGGGALAEPVVQSTFAAVDLAVADLNADGRDELIARSHYQFTGAEYQTVAILSGLRSDGLFAEAAFSPIFVRQPVLGSDLIALADVAGGPSLDVLTVGRAEVGSTHRVEVVPVSGCGIAPECAADFDADGDADVDDVEVFLNTFLAPGPAADLNRDGSVNVEDVAEFVDAFLHGCP